MTALGANLVDDPEGALNLKLRMGSMSLSAPSTSAGPNPERLQSITTEASATPTTTLVTLAASQTGLRIFTGETAASEPFFYLYVSKNGGAVSKVKLYRWQGRILSGVAGDTFALGTTDGRALQCAGMVAPASLAAPSGVTGTANCDQALPGLWGPSAAHVTLPSNGSKLQLNFDGTERVVFIAEKAPDGTWTPPRWVVLPAAVNVVVHCNYTEIALANEAGATLSVTVPTSSTVGGAKTVMSLPMPTITGTSHVCTTGAQFATAIAAAVAGDEIVVSGAITLTGEVTRASFVANELAGRKGYEGILIRGVTSGDATSGTINGGGFGWLINMPGAGDTMTLHGCLKDLTCDWGANAKLGSHGGGKYRHQNLVVTGGTGDAWDYNATNYPITVDALFVVVRDSADDCWNLSGNVTYNAASRLRFFSCQGLRAGANTASQCFTSHFGLAFEIYGGTWSDAFANVFANDAGTTPGYIFWASITKGARKSGVVNGMTLFGCSWEGGESSDAATYFCRMYGALTGSTAATLRNVLIAEHNVITVTVGRGLFNSIGGASVWGNIASGPNECFRFGSAAGAVASTTLAFNSDVGGNIGFSSQDVSNMPISFKNNASRSMGTSINVVTGGGAAVTGNYNTLDATVDVDYTPGANDTQPVDAALNTTSFIPTAAGNCDGNGDATVVDYVGDADPYGFVHIFKSDRVSRGAREIPAIYAGAVLYPEYF